MRRSGLTLIETTLAIAILSSVAVALSVLLSMVIAVGDGAGPTGRIGLEQRRAVEATLHLIGDDLRMGDHHLDPNDAARVGIDGRGALTITTRDGGPLRRAYVHDTLTRSLSVEENRDDSTSVRPLLDRIDAWSALLQDDGTVVVELRSGEYRATRRWRIP